MNLRKVGIKMDYIVNVIGAGLAGSEAAYQLIKRGIRVRLYEMRPKKFSQVHKSDGFAELFCSSLEQALPLRPTLCSALQR